ncbi:MAG: 30S ribosomal protein S20 [Deltaproteobacteria bacterium]|nr:30S ribosomal protein S20 [Deltaproteobacteria bacterium]
MPKPSAAKRARQEATRHERNRRVTSTWRTLVRNVREAMQKNDPKLDEIYKQAASYLDRAQSKGVLHRNNASRRISRLTKAVSGHKTKSKSA